MISRVYGRADSWELEFTHDGGTWNAAVPADMVDGYYVVELQAVNSYGYVSYYTGILYMFDGNAEIRIIDDDIEFRFYLDDLVLACKEDDIDFRSCVDDFTLTCEEDEFCIFQEGIDTRW